jgi:hypothetical protein
MSMTINAVSTSVPFDIKAALSHPEVRGVSRILARAGIKQPTTKFKHSELESCMCSAGIDPVERMRVKIGLDRAGLIDWNA